MRRNRPSWQQHAMNLAVAAADKSEDPYQQVGACALDHKHNVLGVAYNGLAPGKCVDDSFWDDRDARRPFMIHAEANLTSMFKRGECKIVACTLLPCASCAQLLAAYGVEEVVFKEIYDKDQRAIEIFKFYNITLTQLK